MAGLCPNLNRFNEQPEIITKANHKEAILSTYNRTIGTEVTLSCYKPFVLVGPSRVKCQANNAWDASPLPHCANVPSRSEGLSNDTKILIGILVAVGVGIILILMFIICCLRNAVRKSKRRKTLEKTKNGLKNASYNEDEVPYIPPYTTNEFAHKGDYINAYNVDNSEDFSSPIPEVVPPLSNTGKFYSLPRDFDPQKDYPKDTYSVDKNDFNFDRKRRIKSSSLDNILGNSAVQKPVPHVTGSLKYGGDMYYVYKGKTQHKPRYVSESDVTRPEYDIPTKSPERYRSEYIPRDSDYSSNSGLISSEWPSRSDIKGLDEFNKKAVLHGRDPFLWRPVDSNWGYNVRHEYM